MVLMISSICACGILAGLFIVIRAVYGACIEGLLAKTLASFAFVMCALFAVMKAQIDLLPFMLICVGLICGMVGDIILELKVIYPSDQSSYLNSGMISFGLGHLFYVVAMSCIASGVGVKILAPLLISAGGAIAFAILIVVIGKKVLKLQFGNFFYQTMAYSFMLAFATILAFIYAFSAPLLFIMAAGLLLILLSDVVLSQQYFGGKENSRVYHILNHTLYYAGQILIMTFLFAYLVI